MSPSPRSLLRQAVPVAAMVIVAVLATGTAASAKPRPHPATPSPSASPASNVTVTDDSHVLTPGDIDSLRVTGSNLFAMNANVTPDPIRIYTTTELSDDKGAFDEHYRSLLGSAPRNVVIMAVNTEARHIIITTGQNSGISDQVADNARREFGDTFKLMSSYGRALDDALRTLGLGFGGYTAPPATTTSRHHSNAGVVVVLLLVVAVGIGVAIARTGSTGPRYRRSGYVNDTYVTVDSYDSSDLYESSSSDSGSSDSGDSGGGSSSGDF